MIAFKGQIPYAGPPEPDGDRSDFRQVPKTDKGNRGYGDRGQFGTFQTDAEQFGTPKGVAMASGNYGAGMQQHGYGVEAADAERGFCDPGIREAPAYDKANYQDRSTRPRIPDEDQLETNTMADDWEFRGRNRVSRGFLTRPRIPTERN